MQNGGELIAKQIHQKLFCAVHFRRKKNYIFDCTQNIHNANSRRFCTNANQTQLLARVP